MSSREGSFNKFLSHVYVEKRALGNPHTGEILARLPRSEVILIDHYKDIFNRGRQSYGLQSRARALILAVGDGELIYPGAPVCQAFGQKNFYYTASSMNCPFDCEYCFLKGMYSTANIVCFVNVEDYFAKIRELNDPYVCVSFDTDLIAMDSITGQASLWAEFASENPDVLIEMRTKSAPAELRAVPNVIYAYTLSPEVISERFEHGAPPLRARLRSARNAIDGGCNVRICIDPMIYVSGWEEIYGGFADRLASELDLSRIRDVSIGTFRISASYLKTIRRQEPDSEVCWFPFGTEDGYAVYPRAIRDDMRSFMRQRLERYIPGGKIYEDDQ